MRTALAFMLVGALVWPRLQDRFFPGTLRVVFLDVGQGDSAWIRFPSGQNWLVDAGGGTKRWDRGLRDIYLELARSGVLSLEAAVLSHPDSDHVLGFRGLVDGIHLQRLYFNAATPPEQHPVFERVAGVVQSAGTSLASIGSTQDFEVDGVEVKLIPIDAGKSKNNRPLAVLLQWGGCRVLLGGDAEAKAEAWLAQNLAPVDLWKVHHHGSRTSSQKAFLKKLKPRLAVVSSGAGNRYGHPAREVLGRLRNAGVQTERIDFEGAVEYTIASGEIRCRSTRGDCGKIRCLPVINEVRSGLESERAADNAHFQVDSELSATR
ncbi:MBL fold metallo-hydrolase [bacterium]|nr:MBL fold metallo-hydrolase [bacterium]